MTSITDSDIYLYQLTTAIKEELKERLSHYVGELNTQYLKSIIETEVSLYLASVKPYLPTGTQVKYSVNMNGSDISLGINLIDE